MLESSGTVDMMFQRVRGDRTEESRVLVYTRDGTATSGT